mmetsp:Transcript_4764/g.13203  ORF Transcript_4764/g.13203 Transcript_4764/m.13203 type:complete len:244 (-) Transcript_4764:919-1650(-)
MMDGHNKPWRLGSGQSARDEHGHDEDWCAAWRHVRKWSPLLSPARSGAHGRGGSGLARSERPWRARGRGKNQCVLRLAASQLLRAARTSITSMAESLCRSYVSDAMADMVSSAGTGVSGRWVWCGVAKSASCSARGCCCCCLCAAAGAVSMCVACVACVACVRPELNELAVVEERAALVAGGTHSSALSGAGECPVVLQWRLRVACERSCTPHEQAKVLPHERMCMVKSSLTVNDLTPHVVQV